MASDRARRALARLAGEHFGETAEESAPPTATAYGGIIAEATAALEDIEAAAEFVDGGGLDTLERAVERAEGDLSERARQGRETLGAYRAFRAVARDQDGSGPPKMRDDR